MYIINKKISFNHCYDIESFDFFFYNIDFDLIITLAVALPCIKKSHKHMVAEQNRTYLY